MDNKVSIGTITRTIVTLVAVVNVICSWMGWNPLEISESDIYECVSVIALVGATVASWWKNNSFTKSAIQADKIMKELKEGKDVTDN